MSDGLRAIDVSDLLRVDVAGDLGGAPMLQWLAIADLVVDDAYQRPLQGPGLRNVRRIAESFEWSKFATVVVAPVEGGRYAIIDGQHRTTAAALRGVERVPCQVVIADRAKQAAAFKSINGQITRMGGLSLHHAALAAGEAEAVELGRVAAEAGVRILRNPQGLVNMKPGDTMAVGALAQAVRTWGADAVITGLRCVTRTAHNQPGMLRWLVVKALAEVASSAPDADALIAGVGKLPLARMTDQAAKGRSGPGGAAADLAAAIRTRLAGNTAAPTPPAGNTAAPALSPRPLAVAPPAQRHAEPLIAWKGPKPTAELQAKPNGGGHKLDAVRYLEKNGVQIAQDEHGRYIMGAMFVNDDEVVRLVNQFRVAAELPRITIQDLA